MTASERSPQLSSLTVVLPAHDEAANLPHVLEDARKHLPTVAKAWEIVVVDDGSTDTTPDLMAELTLLEPRVRSVRHMTCRGYGASLRTGIEAARMEYVFMTDADRQFGFEPLPAFVAPLARGEADAVLGWRSPRADSWWRRQLGGAWTSLAARLLGVRLRDANCAYKLLPTNVALALKLESTGGAVSVEIAALMKRAGAQFAERPVPHAPRLQGVPSGGSPTVALRALVELAALERRLRTADPSPIRIAIDRARTRVDEPCADAQQEQ